MPKKIRSLPEGSQLSTTLFDLCVAELILESRIKFPLLKYPEITSIDNLNWIGAFRYVDDMVLTARSSAQLQFMINACEDRAERSRMRINHEKTEVMMFYQVLFRRASRFPSHFTPPLAPPSHNPPKSSPLRHP